MIRKYILLLDLILTTNDNLISNFDVHAVTKSAIACLLSGITSSEYVTTFENKLC